MKVLSHLRQQCKKNNKGASLVTVLMIMALVMILITVILSITLINFYMKKSNAIAQANFYDAESAMEEIRTGLTDDISDVASEAYVYTLSNYSALDEDAKTETFQQYYKKLLKEKLWETNGSTYYSRNHLAGFFKETAYNEELQTGAKLITPDSSNYINETDQGLTLKNVKISYTDGEGTVTQLQSDMILTYPPVEFVATSAMDNILCYALIAGDSFQQKGVTSNIEGNVYLGKNESKISSGKLTISNQGNTQGFVIGGGQLTEDTNSSVTLNAMETWLQNLVLNNSSDYTLSDGSLYLQNDMILGTSAKVSLSGSLYAYGDVDTALEAESLSDKADEINASPADYSSSIVVNGKNSGMDLSGLTNMYIAGHSYVKGSTSVNSTTAGTSGSSSVEMGQSIAMKSDQRAYLIPTTLVGSGYTNGGSNPMTGKQYYALLQEIADAKYSGNTKKVQHSDVVDFTATDKTLGVSMTAAGVTDYKVNALATNGGGTMVYLFMTFDSDASANSFYRTYHKTAANYNRLAENLNYYASFGIKMPSDIDKNANFYFDGNVISSNSNSIIINDKLATATEDSKKLEESYQDYFAALNKKLIKNYGSLSKTELTQELFDNLIYSDKIKKEIGNKSPEHFVSVTGEGAVVAKGDYTINKENSMALFSVEDEDGNKHSDAQLNLVIATGNVTVETDFTGLIIAGGTITVKNGANITADATSVAIALLAKNESYQNKDKDEAKTPSYYVRNASAYLIGGIATDDDDEDTINLSTLVTYENWKKQ